VGPSRWSGRSAGESLFVEKNKVWFELGILLFCWVFKGCFGKRWVAGDGFLMVGTWWIGGETWWVEGRFSTTKNTPRF
jgi:hypothetical protein